MTELTTRPAFGLFEGFAASSVLAALEMAELLVPLESGGLSVASIRQRPAEEASLLLASLDYLVQRGLTILDDGSYHLSDFGREVCRDKGYLVWLVGGYGEPLRRLDAFFGHGMRYGTDYIRDGRWVADGAAMLGRADVVPYALKVLEGVSFDSLLDLGCGNARFLLTVSQRFGVSGVGVDLSPEACAEAAKAITAAGLSDRVTVVTGDANDLGAIPRLGEIQLVVTFFLLHEILAQGRDVLVGYLRDMSRGLPDGAHLLIAEVEPPSGDGHELFTPEFTYVHAIMRQRLLSLEDWQEVLAEGGFTVRESIRDGMPGGILLLAQKAPAPAV